MKNNQQNQLISGQYCWNSRHSGSTKTCITSFPIQWCLPMVYRSRRYHFLGLWSIEIGRRARNWSHFRSIERSWISNPHRFEQSRSSASRRIVARSRRFDLEHFAVDVIATATSHVHRFVVVASIWREHPRSFVASARKSTPPRFGSSHRTSHWK